MPGNRMGKAINRFWHIYLILGDSEATSLNNFLNEL